MRARRLFLPLALAALPLLAFLPSGVAWRAAGEPLWSQVQASEIIVLAEVIEVTEDCTGMPEGTDRIARLRVVEAWKGAPSPRIDVPFNDYLIWPPPPKYRVGELIVAFLRRENGLWTTVGMGSGAVHPAGDRLAGLRSRVRRVVAMQRDA